jgi:serine/threonine protein kinase
MSSDKGSTDCKSGYDWDELGLSDERKSSVVLYDPAREEPWQSSGETVHSDPRLVGALEEYMEALDSGTPPSREEFLDQHPTIAPALKECLSGLEFIQTAGLQFGEGPAAEAASRKSEQQFPVRVRLGDYRILRELGRGSMGVVYEAEQISLERRVALKILPFASAIDPRQRQRFLIEAQAAAQLHHPHIVPIFAAGCEQGIHFYAMQYVDGRTLGELVAEYRLQEADTDKDPPSHSPGDNKPGVSVSSESAATLLQTVSFTPQSAENAGNSSCRPGSPRTASLTVSGSRESGLRARSRAREIARLGKQAAEALEHAHGLGVVHRDIKPANLMVDSGGELWITDFGLARFRGDLSLTRSGDLVGTLRYMSPEQALARRGVVDQRTDIYALGLTLYELLTLQTAFNGRDHQELLRQIALDEPVPPRRLNKAIPRDLETIVLKAICKEPSGRYATARELADDLARFLDDKPILARRPSVPERSLRWARRHSQIVLTAAAILTLALIAGTAIVGFQARKTETVSRERLTYIRDSFPLIDQITMTAMQEVSKGAMGPNDEAIGVYQQALNMYEQASKIPPTDIESRTIIARAYNRMGFTRAVMSKRGKNSGLLSQAESDYRQSIAMFESLLAEKPADAEIRSRFAEALGDWGYAFGLEAVGRKDAEQYYRRAIQIHRELALDDGVEPPRRSSELDKALSATAGFAQKLAESGRMSEAQQLCLDMLSTRRTLTILHSVSQSTIPQGTAYALNQVAWFLVSTSDVPQRNVPPALEAAREAVRLVPGRWEYWNTLGVAAYRAGDWKGASEALEKSIALGKGGSAIDWFFLAMTRWQQNQPREALKWLDQANNWTKKNHSMDPEVKQFQAEAQGLVGATAQSPESKPAVKG